MYVGFNVFTVGKQLLQFYTIVNSVKKPQSMIYNLGGVRPHKIASGPHRTLEQEGWWSFAFYNFIIC